MIETTSKRYIWLFFIILISLLVAVYLLNVLNPSPRKPGSAPFPANDNSPGSSYVTIKDSSGKVILQTGVAVNLDDEYINEDNVHYVITKVQGSEALAEPKQTAFSPGTIATLQPTLDKSTAVVATNKARHVVIYHTHDDESFIPTSGQETNPGNGDIFNVGSTFTDALGKSGVSVTHSFNKHDPHDINAYSRSRRTAAQLLKEQPDAAFDIHRDSAPSESYLTSVNGVNSSRIMIVVGRSNPNMQTNLDFASQIKTAADSLYPGLMRGIFIGHGDYNQDLYPTALLFEVGTDTLSEDDSKIAANCLTDAVITVLNQH
ncbi:MAG TPA: stage II sporulation protein P [Syntrophomonadaceae bacterium]|nr:stage II sporulation protein P [Syntrophomonadaceae bacterium]